MAGTLLLDVLKKGKAERTPFWFMRQAGRYLPEYRELREKAGSFLDLCYTPGWAAEVTLQPLRRFDMDAAILFSDILIVPHALGVDLKFVAGEGPKLSTVRNQDDLKKLSLEKVEEHIQPVLETVRRVRAELAPGKTLIGFAGSPWTVACYMVEGGGSRDFENTRKLALTEPALFAKMISLVEQATLVYLLAQIKAGAQVLQLFDSWAGILPPDEFAKWVIEPTTRLANALKAAHPEIPLIGFPRLAGAKIFDYAKIEALDAISIDHTADIHKTRNITGKTLQGNLDPVALAHDLPRALQTARVLLDDAAGKNFIFNLGHGMLPETPVAHVQKLSEVIREHHA